MRDIKQDKNITGGHNKRSDIFRELKEEDSTVPKTTILIYQKIFIHQVLILNSPFCPYFINMIKDFMNKNSVITGPTPFDKTSLVGDYEI